MCHLCRLVRLSIQPVCNFTNGHDIASSGLIDQGLSHQSELCLVSLNPLDRHVERIAKLLEIFWPPARITGLAFCECHLFSVLKDLDRL